jgi:hypothetical protein
VVDGEDHGLTPPGTRDHGAGLLAGALFDEHALAAGEVDVGLTEHDQELQREV